MEEAVSVAEIASKILHATLEGWTHSFGIASDSFCLLIVSNATNKMEDMGMNYQGSLLAEGSTVVGEFVPSSILGSEH